MRSVFPGVSRPIVRFIQCRHQLLCAALLRGSREFGRTGGIRTPNLPVRSRVLCPVELQTEKTNNKNGAANGIRTRVDALKGQCPWPARRWQQ